MYVYNYVYIYICVCETTGFLIIHADYPHFLGGLRGYIPRSKFSNNPFSLKVDAPKNNSVLYVEDHLANHDWSETAVITNLKLL